MAVSAHALPFEQVADGIYVHYGKHLDIDAGYQGDICNLSFIVGQRGVAVIDTGGSSSVGSAMHDAIRQVTSLPVLFVINTHVHPDHIFGNSAFLADSPQFVGHVRLSSAMQARADTYQKLNERLLGIPAAQNKLVFPSLAVSQQQTLDLGGRILTVIAYPSGHTDNDIAVLDTQTATLFAGDILFIERTPVVDGKDIKGLISNLTAMTQLPLRRVVPGHGPTSTQWQADMNKAKHYLETLLADVRHSIKNGVGLEATKDTAAQSEKDKWVLFDIANRRNVNHIYPALEWEE